MSEGLVPVYGLDTITLHFAVVPFLKVAVMVAFPLDFAWIRPLVLTVATFRLEVEKTGFSDVMLGRRITFVFFFSPTERRYVFFLNRILTALGVTLTLQRRVVVEFIKNRTPFLRIFTVITVFPTAFPVNSQEFPFVDWMETMELSSLLNETSSSEMPSTKSVMLSSVRREAFVMLRK